MTYARLAAIATGVVIAVAGGAPVRATVTAIGPAKAAVVSATALHARDAATCAVASNMSACLMTQIDRVTPVDSSLNSPIDPAITAALSRNGATLTTPAERIAASPPGQALQEIVKADRQGGDPGSALRATETMAAADRVKILRSLCQFGQQWTSHAFGPTYTAWQVSHRFSRGLVQAAADGLEHELGSGAQRSPSDTQALAEQLIVCRAQLGDAQGMDRALAFTSTNDPRLKLFSLAMAGRLDEATALAERTRASDMVVAASANPAVAQFQAMQQGLQRLLWAARDAGRVGLGNRIADTILTNAVRTNRPSDPYMDTGVPAALAWLTSQPDKAALANWATAVDSTTRPETYGWNYEDAVAVHRAWIILGRTASANAYLDIVLAEAARAQAVAAAPGAETPPAPSGQPAAGQPGAVTTTAPNAIDTRASRRVLAEMLAEAGKWDEARALGEGAGDVFTEDIRQGVAGAMFHDRLTHASGFDRMIIVRLCAAPAEPAGFSSTARPPTPFMSLDAMAQCVREGVAAAPSATDASEGPMATFALGFGPNSAVMVAAMASQAGRPALAHELLALALSQWSRPEAGQLDLDPQTVALLTDIAQADVSANSKR
jgi:hypothetical protein